MIALFLLYNCSRFYLVQLEHFAHNFSQSTNQINWKWETPTNFNRIHCVLFKYVYNFNLKILVQAVLAFID